MKVFLTLWNGDHHNMKQRVIECSRLIVSDGVEIDVDGDKCQLFDVVSANEVIPHVSVIEII